MLQQKTQSQEAPQPANLRVRRAERRIETGSRTPQGKDTKSQYRIRKDNERGFSIARNLEEAAGKDNAPDPDMDLDDLIPKVGVAPTNRFPFI